MRVCVLSSYIGAEKHVLVDCDKIRWVNEVPNDAFILRGSVSIDDGRSFDHVLRLNCVDVEFTVPNAWKVSMCQLLGDAYDERSVPWSKVIPGELYISLLKKFTTNLRSVIPTLNVDYYNGIYRRGNELLQSLQPVKIDVQAMDDALNGANDAVRRSLETFRPIDGFVPKVTYDRLSTKTGRLTVSSGPSILTLKRELRGLLRSAFSPGAIAYVDFSSLEARTALSVVRKQCYVRDIYTWLKNVEFNGHYERSTMKLAVLSTLFGAGHALGSDGDAIVSVVKRNFDTDALNERLCSELAKNGKVRNFYGRALVPENQKDVISHYVQSTGVDVALLGFNEFIKRASSKNVEFRPLFVLHDALIVDVGKSGMNELKRFVRDGVMVPGMSNVFYASAVRLDEH